MEKIKRYIERSEELFGIGGSDIHLWLESLKNHSGATFEENCKLEKKIKEKFGGTYGEILAWSIAFEHFIMDETERQVLLLEKKDDTLIPVIKTVKEIQDEIQKKGREGNANNEGRSQ